MFKFDKEAIEIGAVKIMDNVIIDEFCKFIKPRDTSITPLCRELPTITDADISDAPDFLTATQEFEQIIGNAKILTLGVYNRKQLLKDFEWHKAEPPFC